MTIQKSTATYQDVAVECAKITADKPCTWRFSKTLNFSGSYAWQFVIKADEDTQVDVTVGNQTEIFDVSTSFELLSHVFENVEADNYPYVEINFPIGEFYIYHTQLEYGDEPTEYNPSGGGIEQDMYDLKKGVRTIIEQLDDKISLVVDGSSTSSSLVLTQDTLDAVANDINLNGRVTFSGLSSTAKSAIADNTLSNIYTEGTTTIDGGKITATSVTAREIDVEDVFAQNVTATGTITGATIVGASGEFTERFLANVQLSDAVGNEVTGYLTFNPDGPGIYMFLAQSDWEEDPQATIYGEFSMDTTEMQLKSNGDLTLYSDSNIFIRTKRLGNGVEIYDELTVDYGLNALGGVYCEDQLNLKTGTPIQINGANGSGNSRILTSTSSGTEFKSLYDLVGATTAGEFNPVTVGISNWVKVGSFTANKGRFVIVTNVQIENASGGSYQDGVVGLGINTGTSTKTSFSRWDSKVNCNAGSVFLQNVRVCSFPSSTTVNVWVRSTQSTASSATAGYMFLRFPG